MRRAGREDTDLSQNLTFSAWDYSAEPSNVHNLTEQGQIPADSSSSHITFSLFFYFEPVCKGK